MEPKQFIPKLLGGLLGLGKVMLVIVAIAAGLVLLAALAEFHRDIQIPKAAVGAWLIVIGLAVVLVVLFFAMRWAVRLFMSSTGIWSLFGDTAASRVIGLGAVTLIYPQAIVSLVTVPIVVLVQFFADVPQVISRVIAPWPMGDETAVSLDQVFYNLILLLQGIASEASRTLYRLFEQIPERDAVLALALWVIIGQLLSTPGGAVPARSPESRPVRLIGYLRNLSEKQRRNLWIGLVFFAGIYLSIAAIVAIPWLQDDKAPQGLTRENLEKALQTLVPKPDAADRASVVTTDTSKIPDPLAQLEETLNQTIKRLDETKTTDRASFAIEDIRRNIATVKTARTELQERLRQLRDDTRQKPSQIVNEALIAFDAEMLSPLNVQERVVFFREIQRSAQSQVADIERALRDCVRAASDAERQIGFFASDSIGALSRLDASAPNSLELRSAELNVLFSRLSPRNCSPMSLGPFQYSIPDPVATWGPFALVSQWLLRTKSYALALITGMLGFGLLGAAIATFIRRSDSAGSTSPAGDAATIVVRGVSAAIVVFLAVKGGLTIVSTSEAEPNAYVLFFTCLVGAVFSEGVWLWAKSKLDGILSNDKGGTKPQQGGKLSANAPGAAPPGTDPKPDPASATPPS